MLENAGLYATLCLLVCRISDTPRNSGHKDRREIPSLSVVRGTALPTQHWDMILLLCNPVSEVQYYSVNMITRVLMWVK